MNPLVESVISNVAIGAGNPQSGDRSTRPELGRVQVSFVEYEKRHGRATTPILDSIRAALKGIPGADNFCGSGTERTTNRSADKY